MRFILVVLANLFYWSTTRKDLPKPSYVEDFLASASIVRENLWRSPLIVCPDITNENIVMKNAFGGFLGSIHVLHEEY